MSTAEQARQVRWGYEPHTPVCGNCTGYRKAQVVTRATGQVLHAARCVPGRFDVQAHGCCDKWRDRMNGERLA